MEILGRILHALKGIGKSPDKTALRTKPETADLPVPKAPPAPTPEPGADSLPETRTATSSNNRMPALNSKTPKTKEQWDKIKKTAKDVEPTSGSVDHWAQKANAGGILSGTTFDAATTDVANGPRAHKRPTMVTQARITHGRLQALQAQIEKPKNEFDKACEDEPDDGQYHGH